MCGRKIVKYYKKIGPGTYKICLIGRQFIIAKKIGRMRMVWQLTFEGTTTDTSYCHLNDYYKEALERNFVSPFEKCKYLLNNLDTNSEMSDDHRVVIAGQDTIEAIRKLWWYVQHGGQSLREHKNFKLLNIP